MRTVKILLVGSLLLHFSNVKAQSEKIDLTDYKARFIRADEPDEYYTIFNQIALFKGFESQNSPAFKKWIKDNFSSLYMNGRHLVVQLRFEEIKWLLDWYEIDTKQLNTSVNGDITGLDQLSLKEDIKLTILDWLVIYQFCDARTKSFVPFELMKPKIYRNDMEYVSDSKSIVPEFTDYHIKAQQFFNGVTGLGNRQIKQLQGSFDRVIPANNPVKFIKQLYYFNRSYDFLISRGAEHSAPEYNYADIVKRYDKHTEVNELNVGSTYNGINSVWIGTRNPTATDVWSRFFEVKVENGLVTESFMYEGEFLKNIYEIEKLNQKLLYGDKNTSGKIRLNYYYDDSNLTGVSWKYYEGTHSEIHNSISIRNGLLTGTTLVDFEDYDGDGVQNQYEAEWIYLELEFDNHRLVNYKILDRKADDDW